MPKPDHAPGYVPNDAYTQEDWDEVCDNPELTDAEIAELRANGEGLPANLAAAFKRLGGRPKSGNKAVPVSLRVPPDVLAAYKADGPGWQTRMNAALLAGVRADSGADEAERLDRAARRAAKEDVSSKAGAVLAGRVLTERSGAPHPRAAASPRSTRRPKSA